MSDLFRREAVQHATRRLEGTVVLATPVSIKTLGLFLAAVLFATAGFAAQATYARKATVIGYLVPDQGMIRATSQTPGTLQSILVREGDVVKGGDRIAVLGLSTETTAGNVGEVVSQGLKAEAQAARSKAESRLAQREVERDQSKIRLSKGEAELKQVMMQVNLQEQRLQLARSEVERGEEIAKKGYLARREVEARRGVALTAEQELAGHRRQQAAIERDIADIRARLASIPLEIDSARSEAESAEAVLQQRRAETEARRLQFVIAPVGGRIAALPVTTGQTVIAGANRRGHRPRGRQARGRAAGAVARHRLRATRAGGGDQPAGFPLPALRHSSRHGAHGVEHRPWHRTKSAFRGSTFRSRLPHPRGLVARGDAGLRRDLSPAAGNAGLGARSCSTAARYSNGCSIPSMRWGGGHERLRRTSISAAAGCRSSRPPKRRNAGSPAWR